MALSPKILAAILLVTGPALAQDSGFLTDYSNLVVAPDDTGANLWFIEPGYGDRAANSRGLFVDSVVFFVANDSKYKGLKPEEMALIGNSMRDALMRELHGEFTVMDFADEGGLVLRVALSDVHLKKHKRGLLSYTPVGAVAHAAKGAFEDVMAKVDLKVAMVELEVVDVSTGDIVAAATVKRGKEGSKKDVTSWEEVQADFSLLGKRIACRLNNARKPEASRVDCLAVT